jgi:DNA-binding beta-propeller fold protein YncE
VAEVSTGQQPRSMDISTDGSALYVVNYGSGTMTKLAADDLRTLQELPTGANPIGITYDDATGKVWVANYSGTIDIYDEVTAT